MVSIIRCLIEFENTVERIEQLREEIAGYVERYEEYYYQYNYDRVCVCKLVVHALLHVADDVLRCGPMWSYWSFIVERYCREVTACARQRTVPFSTIDQFVLQAAQLSTVAMRYQDIRKALLFGKADAPVETSRMERIYPDYPHAILRSPLLPGFLLQPNVRRRVVAFLRTNNPGRTFQEWIEYLPERCERWGKLRIADGGPGFSFIRFTFWKDKNENRRNLPVELVPETGYGRLDFILAITLPPDPRFNIDAPKLHILAHITEAKGAEGDATTKLVSYTQLGRSFVLDITAVENVVGRVETKGVRAAGEWVIVDRSQGLCRTVFHQDELEFEGEDD